MAKKQYLDLTGLTTYDEQIKAYIDAADAATSTKLTSGTIVVKEAQHATSADTATNATNATNADKLGGQLPSYYAKATDIPTGALADKDIVSESDLDSALAAKVNAAAEGSHSHSNKTVLDGITAAKVTAWDSAEANAKAYADSAASTAANTVKNDLLNGAGTAYDTLKELGDLIDDNVDAIEVLETIAVGKADKDHVHSWNDFEDKPFGEEIVEVAIVPEESVEVYNSGVELSVAVLLEANSTYKVIFDSVEYECVPKTRNTGYMQMYWLGNTTIISSDLGYGDTGEPFCLEFGEYLPSTGMSGCQNVKLYVKDGYESDNPHTVEVYSKTTTVVCLDEKYIPDTIARIEDVTSKTEKTDFDALSSAVKAKFDSVESAVLGKADKATTLSGYGITDAYTKTEVDNKLSTKAAQSSLDSVSSVANEAKSAAAANTQSISAHTSSINTHTSQISALQGLVGEGVEAIPTASITALF